MILLPTALVVNPRQYTGSAVITTAMDGRPELFNVNQQARWISADSGKRSR